MRNFLDTRSLVKGIISILFTKKYLLLKIALKYSYKLYIINRKKSFNKATYTIKVVINYSSYIFKI